MNDNTQNENQSADYIESMLVELRSISVQSNYHVLTYLIEVAILEASDILSGKHYMNNVNCVKPSRKKRTLTAEQLAAMYMFSNVE